MDLSVPWKCSSILSVCGWYGDVRICLMFSRLKISCISFGGEVRPLITEDLLRYSEATEDFMKIQFWCQFSSNSCLGYHVAKSISIRIPFFVMLSGPTMTTGRGCSGASFILLLAGTLDTYDTFHKHLWSFLAIRNAASASVLSLCDQSVLPLVPGVLATVSVPSLCSLK